MTRVSRARQDQQGRLEREALQDLWASQAQTDSQVDSHHTNVLLYTFSSMDDYLLYINKIKSFNIYNLL